MKTVSSVLEALDEKLDMFDVFAETPYLVNGEGEYNGSRASIRIVASATSLTPTVFVENRKVADFSSGKPESNLIGEILAAIEKNGYEA